MAATVYIVSTGARTPLGLEAAPSAAALRAGISGMGRHPFMIDPLGDPMPAALDPVLDPGRMGPERLVALAESALREACAPLMDWPGPRLSFPLFLGLPEIRPGFSEQDAEAIRTGVSRLAGLPVGLSEVRVFPHGHAAGLGALALATELIRRGSFEACLVGGVESYFHADTMDWLVANRQLATADARSAFVPGEGAGVCLLMGESLAQKLNVEESVRVLSAGTAQEPKRIKTDTVCLGEGLTASVRAAIEAMPTARPIDDIICDINGERYRGEEWGFVCLRLPLSFRDLSGYLSPADTWGDMGAASGPLFAMLAWQAATRGYAHGPRTMLWASSEGGQRAAVVLESTRGHRHG